MASSCPRYAAGDREPHTRTAGRRLRRRAGKEMLLKNGALAQGGTPAQFAEFIRAEAAKWAKVAKFADIHLD